MLPWAVLWDMDGTLVDTAELHFAAWRECCNQQGRDFTEADFQATFGRRNPEILRFLLGDHLTDEEVARQKSKSIALNPEKQESNCSQGRENYL